MKFQAGQEAHNKLPQPSKDVLERMYWVEGLTSGLMAKHFNVTDATVRNWLRRSNIPRRPSGTGLSARLIAPPSAEELEDMIHVQHLSYSKVAEKYGVDQSAVPHWLDNHGIERSKSWHERYSNPDSLAELRRLYDSGLTLQDLAEIHGVSRVPLARLFRENGIPLRRDGWQGGRRFDTKDGHRVRSTYECKVSDWLFDHGIDYTYEPPLPFSNLWHSDFLANGWYIEVWGVTNSNNYKARKIAKQEQYRVHGVPLINLPVHSFDTAHNGQWKRSLAQCLEFPTS